MRWAIALGVLGVVLLAGCSSPVEIQVMKYQILPKVNDGVVDETCPGARTHNLVLQVQNHHVESLDLAENAWTVAWDNGAATAPVASSQPLVGADGAATVGVVACPPDGAKHATGLSLLESLSEGSGVLAWTALPTPT